ncbi:MAG: glutaredoxin family protein [Rhodoferax sp.]|nr:glutaredoxin family protein [Rhodoferax sp.]
MTFKTSFCAASAVVLALAGHMAMAQQVYKIVGPDGKITFSDKPPVADKSKVTAPEVSAVGQAAGGSDLPYELRKVAAQYPVTLYTSNACAPCDTGRALLKSRGIPFTERTVTTNEDIEALQRLAGDNAMPFATIGGQRLKGFSDVEWSRYLDAAGYPASTQLPKSYRYAAATPLVAVQKPAAAPAKDSSNPNEPVQAATPPPSGPSPSNPAGISF